MTLPYYLVLEIGEPGVFPGAPDRERVRIDEGTYDILLELIRNFPVEITLRDLPNFTGALISKALTYGTEKGIIFDELPGGISNE